MREIALEALARVAPSALTWQALAVSPTKPERLA